MIETKRCYLRKFKLDDAQMMFNNWANDEEVTKYLTWNPHQSVEVTKEFINTISKNNRDFAIVYKETNELIGSIAIVDEEVNFSQCELGYVLAKKYWGKGIMTEVAQALIDYLFEQLNYQQVAIKHAKENIASKHVIEKCGLRRIGEEDILFQNKGWFTVVKYLITKKEHAMFKLTNELSQKFDIFIPYYLDHHQLFQYLSSTNFLVKKVTMIDDERINTLHNDFIYTTSIKNLNIVDYYIIGLRRKVFDYNKYVHNFLNENAEYVISDTDKSLEMQIVSLLKRNNMYISFGESCTGGQMVSTLINVSGASNVIKESFVTYSEDAKVRILGVKESTIQKYSVYSKEVVKEMAHGLYLRTKANLCVSISGRAGGHNLEEGSGSFDFCIELNYHNEHKVICEHYKVSGNRNHVRTKQVNYCLFKVLKLLKSIN